MTVCYHSRNRKQIPDYMCQQDGIEHGKKRCQQIAGATIEKAIRDLLLEMVNPLNLQVALSVQAELESRLDQADHLRQQHVERARYEADLARRRFMQVDPENRLVADVLEAEWNDRLRQLDETQAEYEQQREADRKLFTDEQREKTMALTSDFPKLWNDPRTTHRDRKRIVRLLIEDVTIIRDDDLIILHIRFKGGATTTVKVPPPPSGSEKYRTDPETVSRIDALLDDHTDGQIADILNAEGVRSGKGLTFGRETVRVVRRKYSLKSRRQRLIERGLLPAQKVAETIDTQLGAVANWRRRGVLKGKLLNDNGQYMYEPPDDDVLIKIRGAQKYRPRPMELAAKQEEA